MIWDDLTEFSAKKAQARTDYHARTGEWPNKQQTAEAMGCTWRTFQRWDQKERQAKAWADRQQQSVAKQVGAARADKVEAPEQAAEAI
jgi:hypothetical protein